jgi:hypothetical protein
MPPFQALGDWFEDRGYSFRTKVNSTSTVLALLQYLIVLCRVAGIVRYDFEAMSAALVRSTAVLLANAKEKIYFVLYV